MAEQRRPVPLAYFLTFTCYGTWLHGRDRGSVDAEHNHFGEAFVAGDPAREARNRERMAEPAFTLDGPRRQIVLATIREVASHRGWTLLAVHVRPAHIHIVLQGNADPDKMLDDFKAYATRRLKEAGFDPERKRRWTEGGSTRFLWKPEGVEAATRYVVKQQGEAMELYHGPTPL